MLTDEGGTAADPAAGGGAGAGLRGWLVQATACMGSRIRSGARRLGQRIRDGAKRVVDVVKDTARTRLRDEVSV